MPRIRHPRPSHQELPGPPGLRWTLQCSTAGRAAVSIPCPLARRCLSCPGPAAGHEMRCAQPQHGPNPCHRARCERCALPFPVLSPAHQLAELLLRRWSVGLRFQPPPQVSYATCSCAVIVHVRAPRLEARREGRWRLFSRHVSCCLEGLPPHELLVEAHPWACLGPESGPPGTPQLCRQGMSSWLSAP